MSGYLPCARATDRVRSSRIDVAFTKLCRRAFVRPCAWGGFERQKPEQEPKPGHGNVHALLDATLRQLLQSAASPRAAPSFVRCCRDCDPQQPNAHTRPP